MIKGYSNMNYKKIEYQWTIINFTDYFKFANEFSNYDIISSQFDIDKREKLRFYLKMTFSLKSIIYSLKCLSREELTSFTYQLSVVNKDGKTFKTINNDINHTLLLDFIEGNQPHLEVPLRDLLCRASELFPNNHFKVLCNLTVFGKNNSVGLLTSPKHHRSINDHFKELLKSQNGSDVIFEVDGQEFKAHKLILMARSPVFSAMFTNDMIENNSNRVKIEDISPSVFKLLIEFIYTDEITTELDLETGIDLLAAASKYQLEGLEALCEAKLINLLTVNNALDILAMTESHNCPGLVESIKNFITIHQQDIQSIIESSIILIK